MSYNQKVFLWHGHRGKETYDKQTGVKIFKPAPIVETVSFCVILTFLKIGYFIHLHFKCYPFPGFPSANTLFQPPLPYFHEDAPLWPIYSCLTAVAFLYTGTANLHRTKGLFSHWCQIRPLQLLEYFPLLLHWHPFAQSNGWLWASTSVLVRI